MHAVCCTMQIFKRDENLIVPRCRVSHRYDSSRTGSVWIIHVDHTQNPPQKICYIQWDTSPDVIVQKDISSIDRLYLVKSVLINTSFLSGKMLSFVQGSNPKYVCLDFGVRSTIGDRVGKVWFDHKELSRRRMQYRLKVYLSYPHRMVRFTVQELVGMSIGPWFPRTSGCGFERLTPQITCSRLLAFFVVVSL